MSNRLEQEFPKVAWAATSPIVPGGVPPEVMQAYMARGPALRSQAVCDGMRASSAAGARGLLAIAFVRRATRRSASRRPERERWPAPRLVFDQRWP